MDSRFDGVRGGEHPDWLPAEQSACVAWIREYRRRTSEKLNGCIDAWRRGDEMPPMPRTPWYPASIRPVREGRYEWRCSVCAEVGCESPHLVWYPDKWDICRTSGFEWRGLTKEAR